MAGAAADAEVEGAGAGPELAGLLAAAAEPPDDAVEDPPAGALAPALEAPLPLPPGGSTDTPPLEGADALVPEEPLVAVLVLPEPVPELPVDADVEELEPAGLEGLAVDGVDDVEGDDVEADGVAGWAGV